MSSPWFRTAAEMSVGEFYFRVQGEQANGANPYKATRQLTVYLRSIDCMKAVVKYVGNKQWRLEVRRNSGTLLLEYQCGTETGCRSKAKRFIAAKIAELRPTYATQEKMLAAEFIERGWKVIS